MYKMFLHFQIVPNKDLSYLSGELAPTVPSSYSRKMNQMVTHEIQDLHGFRHVECPSPIGGDAVLLVFVCSVTGAPPPPSNVLE